MPRRRERVYCRRILESADDFGSLITLSDIEVHNPIFMGERYLTTYKGRCSVVYIYDPSRYLSLALLVAAMPINYIMGHYGLISTLNVAGYVIGYPGHDTNPTPPPRKSIVVSVMPDTSQEASDVRENSDLRTCPTMPSF